MKVRWTAAARQDRADIVDYIAAENPRAALRLDQLFSDAAARLADFPLSGPPGKVPGTRDLIPHESYRLVYEVDEAAHVVWVMVLVHTARQWPPEAPSGSLVAESGMKYIVPELRSVRCNGSYTPRDRGQVLVRQESLSAWDGWKDSP